MDHFSPLAPAHIRVLVLPVGQTERQRFLSFLRRLQKEVCRIPLSDVEQKGGDNGFFLSPKAFPPGSLLYRFSAAVPSEQQQQLSPFELFREPLLVLGVVDGLKGTEEECEKELAHAAAYLKERHPRVVHRQLVVLQNGAEEEVKPTQNAISIANAGKDDDRSLRTAMCELSARFLIELTSYAKAMQVAPSIQTPGQTARSLQRNSSVRESERRSESGRSTPPSISSPTEEGSPARPPSRAPPLPATSFDQIPSANREASLARSDSRTSNQSDRPKKSRPAQRASSQDRVSVQGFGSSTSQEKVRVRGKARVGIVLSSIYMMAGHWAEALRMLNDHTGKAKAMSDHLWHAKGLENMAVCMLLLAWSGVDFQVPSLCDPITDRNSAANAARITAETKAATEGSKQQLQLFRLSVALPELARLMLSLYRSPEGSLELPFLQVSEASIRAAKLLAFMSSIDGKLTPESLKALVTGDGTNVDKKDHTSKPFRSSSALGRGKALSKSAIADLIAQAPPSDEDGLAIGDHIRILAGISSTYAVLGLDRKKAMTIKDLVVRLTGALIQARKLGAAEIGIHPAASLSTDTGADTLLTIAEESAGVNDLLVDVSRIYGANLASCSKSDFSAFSDIKSFGSPALKFDLLRELAAFCEASPDPYGVLLLTTSLLRAAGPNSAIDATPENTVNALTREEQMHLATVISRTVAVSKHIGLTDVLAVYWDPFLVRGVDIPQPRGTKAVIDRSKLKKADSTIAPAGPGNPLLYDPNASRPPTAAKRTFLLVEKESTEVFVTLQNPYDIPIDVASLELVTEGVELDCHWDPVTLGPMRFQQVSILVSPKSVGVVKISGCRVKMQGCAAQVFQIVPQAWSAKIPLTVKEVGLDARCIAADDVQDVKKLGIEIDVVTATVIDALPTLVSGKDSSLESGIMLLEGERRGLELSVRNDSSIAARIFEIADTSDVLSLAHSNGLNMSILLEPGQSTTFHFEVIGKAGVVRTLANFFYAVPSSSDTKYARVMSIPVEMTINAALQVLQLEVFETDDSDVLLVAFDIRNAWPKAISYDCLGSDFGSDARKDSGDFSDLVGALAPGEIRRLYLTMSNPAHGVDMYDGDVEAVRAKFLQRLVVSWKVDGRGGMLNLQSVALTPESLLLLRGPPVTLTFSMLDKKEDTTAVVGSFVGIRVELRNRGKRSGPLSVVLQPRASDSPQSPERCLAVAGSLHRLSPPLEAGAHTTVDFVVCPLLAGNLGLKAIVRPAEEKENWYGRASLTLSVTNS